MEIVLKALEATPKRFEEVWMDKDELLHAKTYPRLIGKNEWPSLEEVLEWEKQDTEALKERVEKNTAEGKFDLPVRRVLSGMTKEGGEYSKQGEGRGRGEWEGWTFQYFYFESELPIFRLRTRIERDLSEGTVSVWI